MAYAMIPVALRAIMEIIIAMATIRILPMRSNIAYCAALSTLFIADELMRGSQQTPQVRIIALGLINTIGLPLLMSVGSLRTRITRVAAIEASSALTEVIGMSIYALLSGGATVPTSIGPQTITTVVSVYLILIMTQATLLEMLVDVFDRPDSESDPTLSLPTSLLFLSTLICLVVVSARFFVTQAGNFQRSLLIVSYCWLALVGSYATLTVARREVASQREAAEAALTVRRLRHTKGEVEALARRAESMCSLRHALANDVRAVHRIAGVGNIAEANRRLIALQEQAHVLNEERLRR